MAKIDKQALWKEVLESVRVSVSPAIYSTWISQTNLTHLRKVDKKRYTAEIGCASSYVKQTVEKRYFGLMQDALIAAIDAPCDLTFKISSDPAGLKRAASPEINTPLFNSRARGEEMTESLTRANIRPGFTFKNYAVSASNQMAWAACEAVARQPGIAYNPLFLWGGVGVGKTHLMHSVGYRILKDSVDAKILACTSEDFANDIIEGIRNKTTQRFREKYRKLDALFIDDIQFIAGKDAIQEEFFHTFNAMTGAGGQIILTSDQPPSDISKLEERLKSRFEAGLIVDIAPPDFELRCAIIQIKCEERRLDLDNSQVQLVAGNLDSARKIEGFLIRLSSEVKIKKAAPTEELVKSLLGRGVLETNRTKVTRNPDEVLLAVCTHYSIGKRAMLGKARTKMIARPRQILMYILRTELQLSLEEVGRIVGGRDHSTVLHGVQRITKLSSEDVQTRDDIVRIKRYLWG